MVKEDLRGPVHLTRGRDNSTLCGKRPPFAATMRGIVSAEYVAARREGLCPECVAKVQP
jgi:hypothetical protein